MTRGRSECAARDPLLAAVVWSILSGDRMHKSLRVSLAALAIAAASLMWLQAQEPAFDLIIRGGHIVDGTGNPWFAGDVGVRGDRIAAVGNLAGAKAGREIDARGLVVAPGFIDMHTHSDQPLLDDGNAESKVREGVTLDVIGESTSVAPRDGLPEAKSTWTDFTGYWNALKVKGISMNVISEVSFQQIRLVVKGYQPGPATPGELERMKELARDRCMKERGGSSRDSKAAAPSIRTRSSRLPKPWRRSAASTRRTLAAKACSRTRRSTSRSASPTKRRFRSTSFT